MSKDTTSVRPRTSLRKRTSTNPESRASGPVLLSKAKPAQPSGTSGYGQSSSQSSGPGSPPTPPTPPTEDDAILSTDYWQRGLRYAYRVLDGTIPACTWVKLACQRQIDDLARQTDPAHPEWQWVFSKPKANRICAFIECLPHIKGRWRSQNVELEDWQCFSLTVIFGWVNKETGYRRFRKVYFELPRKQGKSFLAAAVGLYLLCADDEPGPEIYSAAVTRDQAKIVWEVAQLMVKREPEMQEAFGVKALAHIISVPSTAGVFRPLSRDADSLEGLNPHGAIIDELHAHKTREVFDVLNQATGSRRQSLLFIITTAGDNRNGICYEQHNYVTQVLQGRHNDDRYFGIIYTCDPNIDWVTDAAARMANPNYGISVLPDDIQSICAQAQRSAESQNTYLTKRLNIWVSTGTAYFNILAWNNKCKAPEITKNGQRSSSLNLEDFYEHPCTIAIDLASKVDIAVKIMLFHEDGKRYVFGKYYLPEAAVEKGNPNYDFYAGWVRTGLLTITPGNVIDFDFIESDLMQDRDMFQVREFCFDPYQATELSTRMLKEGLPMVEVGATVRNFSEPMKLLEALIISGGIIHNGDLIMGWMLGNVMAHRDAKDNVYPRKIRNENKIDGAVGLIMGLGRDMVNSQESVYEKQGLMMI